MQICSIIMPVIVCVLIGILCRKKQILTESAVNGLQSLVMNFTLPATLFAAFYKNTISKDLMLLPVTLFVLTVGGIFVGKIVANVTKRQDPYLPYMMTGYEAGMLGYALLGLLVGSGNITTFAIADIGHSVAIFTVYTALVKSFSGEKQTARDVVIGIAKTPVLICVVGGMILAMTGIGTTIGNTAAGTVIDTVCDFVSKPTSTIVLIVIGYRIHFENAKWGRMFADVLMRAVMQVIFGAAVLGIFHAIGGTFSSTITTLTIVIFLILPPPYILPLMINKDRSEDQSYYSGLLSLYTIFSMIGFAVLAFVQAGL